MFKEVSILDVYAFELQLRPSSSRIAQQSGTPFHKYLWRPHSTERLRLILLFLHLLVSNKRSAQYGSA